MKRERTRWGYALLLTLCTGCATGGNERSVMQAKARQQGGGGFLASRLHRDSTQSPQTAGAARASALTNNASDERLVRYFPALKQQATATANPKALTSRTPASSALSPSLGSAHPGNNDSTSRAPDEAEEPSSVLPVALEVGVSPVALVAPSSSETPKRDGSALVQVAAMPALDRTEPGVITTSVEVVEAPPAAAATAPALGANAFAAPPPPVEPSQAGLPAQTALLPPTETQSPTPLSGETQPIMEQPAPVVMLPTSQVLPAPQYYPPVPSKQMPTYNVAASAQCEPTAKTCCLKDKLGALKAKVCCFKLPTCDLKAKLCSVKDKLCFWKHKTCCLKGCSSQSSCGSPSPQMPAGPSPQASAGPPQPFAPALTAQNSPGGFRAGVAPAAAPLFPPTYYSVVTSRMNGVSQSTAATNPVPAPTLPQTLGAAPAPRDIPAPPVAASVSQPKKRTLLIVRFWNRLHGKSEAEPALETTGATVARSSGNAIPNNFTQGRESIQRVSTDSVNESSQR